ncbi:hypothetical protein MTYP_01097 [Methylophilaceae bacterium]|nr:hypothetical protein MTYP_01097 [Methylophilaceae bacterium]
MTTPNFRFPRPLGAAISRLPTLPPSFVFTRVLNLLLQRSLYQQELLPLHGKRIAICISDAGLQFHFTVGDKGFRPVPRASQPDLAITATAHDFYLLATRQEDPDSLFFSRRLLVEGDTELGLVAKNTLDGLELPKPVLVMLSPKNLPAWAKSPWPANRGP